MSLIWTALGALIGGVSVWLWLWDRSGDEVDTDFLTDPALEDEL